MKTGKMKEQNQNEVTINNIILEKENTISDLS